MVDSREGVNADRKHTTPSFKDSFLGILFTFCGDNVLLGVMVYICLVYGVVLLGGVASLE